MAPKRGCRGLFKRPPEWGRPPAVHADRPTSSERSAPLLSPGVEQVSVKSDLEAKTVEVVGNAGPFEVGMHAYRRDRGLINTVRTALNSCLGTNCFGLEFILC